jgi:hypothetical protein
VAGRVDDRLLGAHPVGELPLELEVERKRAVEQARAGQRRAVALERVAGALLHARVARQPEVVVRAEHHALGALHLHDGPGLALHQAEVRDEVVLARRPQQLDALVVARLLEQVDCGFGHGIRSPPCHDWKFAQSARGRT